jgi:hypothetical protein
MRKTKRSRPYFTERLNSATHPKGESFAIGDRVSLFGQPNQAGTIAYLVRSNGGKGRPYANVNWENGRSTLEPIGRLKKVVAV